MDDPIAHGHAFVAGDLWRAPSSFLQPPEQHDSIFEALDTTRVDLPKSEESPHFRFHADLPELPDLENVTEHQFEGPEGPPLAAEVESENLDVWNLDHALVDLPKPKYLTWEIFDGKANANLSQTALLSETGPSGFDALTCASKREGVLPQSYALRALCSLAHGRSSALFRWNEETRAFQAVLQGVTISGISASCTDSLVVDIIETGTSIVRLRKFAEVVYSSSNACPAVVAMQNGLANVLDAIDDILCKDLTYVRSLLQLQHSVARPKQLLAVFTDLLESARGCKTDESLISAISDRIHATAQSDSEYSAVLRVFLARVSVPWLERLSAELGLCSTPPAMVGTSFGNSDELKRESHTFLDDIDVDLIRETKTAVTLLRNQSPGHPLLGSGPPEVQASVASFTSPDTSLRELSDLAQLYEEQMVQHLVDNNLDQPNESKALPTEAMPDEHRLDDITQETYISGLEDLMSQDIDKELRQVPDELQTLVGHLCRSNVNHDQRQYPVLSTCVSSTPLERALPFVRTQNRLVNGVLLRQLLRDHRLLQELEKQKQFQLLGNGDFVARLSTALFSLDVQSAERKRGVIPTGEVMGLRLGSSPEQRWPPASSELRLTLAGVLEESQGVKAATTENRRDQFGALSFAVRELPEEEIDRVLDVHSVHALDFLRLQYVPVAPVDAVLTPEAMQQYDDVFRFLMKLLRQIHVVKSLPRRKFGDRGGVREENTTAFANESHHLVSVLMAHVMELGINAPWRVLVTSIKQLEQALKDEDTSREIGTKASFGIQGLRQLHEACLDRMRCRLFLKRKHTKLRTAIEAVFATILKCAARISAEGTPDLSEFEQQFAQFRQECLQLCELLHQAAEKPPKARSATESEDADTMRTLLLKLNWNDFYTQSRSERLL